MRRAIAIVLLALGLAACGSSAASHDSKPTRIEFGITGGNMIPYRVVISPSGAVRETGASRIGRKQIPVSTVASLSSLIRHDYAANFLMPAECNGTLPDVGSQFIRAQGRTITVHGNCERSFERLWTKLAAAVGLQP